MKALLFANTDWYLYNFRLSLARALRRNQVDVLLVSPHGPYGERLIEEGFRWIPVPMMRRSLDPFRETQLIAHLVRLYRRERPDIVHHFTIKCVVYGSLAASLAGVKHRINAITGLGYVFMNRDLHARLLKPFVSTLLRVALSKHRSILILQNSDDCADFERNRLIDKERIRLIKGSGVDTTRFKPVEGRRSSDQLRILFAARLLWDKGVSEYVHAAKQLKDEGLKVQFFLAGAPDPGNPASIPVSRIEEWRKAGVVEVLGHIENIVEWWQQMDVAVLPSHREGLPRGLIEAASCGVAIVTTDVPGCREVVDHGVNGLLVPPHDARSLAQALRFMIEHPEERARMGAAARSKVLREFDERLILRKTLDAYQELLSTALPRT